MAARSAIGLASLALLIGVACGDTASPEPGPATEPRVAATAIEDSATPSPTPPAREATRAPLPVAAPVDASALRVASYPVPAGSAPHDVAPAPDGGVWYTAQGSGELGWLDPLDGRVVEVALGGGSRPHGVIAGPDGNAWITDGGLNAIVRVAWPSREVRVYPLPASRPNANLNTAAFDGDGILWFTGQNGVIGRLDPGNGAIEVFDAPRGRGPYGITSTPAGEVYFVSLAGSYLGRIDRATGAVTVLEPPTAGQGARRAWADSQGRIWVSAWNTGQVAVYDPATEDWREWTLPGARPQAYAVYVDERDAVWLTDFGANALVRFLPESETFDVVPLPSVPSNVRQLLGRPGELWAPESAADRLVVVRWG